MNSPETLRLDFFELGDKTALICTDLDLQDPVRAVLQELGFKLHSVDSPDIAIEQLRYTTYDCLIVQETFAGSSLWSNAVLNFLAPLPMAQRRNSFVCLIGPTFKTLDAIQAFAQSVHVVVNPIDLPNLAPILKKSLAEFELQYRTYKAVVAARGEN
jgi:hypothetical protein